MGKSINEKVERKIIIVAFLFIPVAFLLVFSYWPCINMFLTGFTDWNGISANKNFVGFDNYKELMHDKETLITFKNNFAYLIVVIFQSFLALYFAIALDMKIRGRNAMKTILFMPYVLNGVAIAFMFNFMYQYDGPINQILFALSGHRVSWLGASYFSNFSLAFIGTWRWTGFNMVIFLGALQSVSDDQKEAAYIDGASFFQTIRYIIIPNIKRVVELVFFMGLSSVVNAYFEPYVITKGGPGNTTQTFVTKQLDIAFRYHKFGKACAMGVCIVIIVVILRQIQRIVLGDVDDET